MISGPFFGKTRFDIDSLNRKCSGLVICMVFFIHCFFKYSLHFRQTKFPGISTGCAISANLIMLNFLGTGNDGSIKNLWGHVFIHDFIAFINNPLHAFTYMLATTENAGKKSLIL